MPLTATCAVLCTPRDDVRTYQRQIERTVKRLLCFFTEHPEQVAPSFQNDSGPAESNIVPEKEVA